MLLLGPDNPLRTRLASRTAATANHESRQVLRLKSEDCAVQCLFASWLTKTSKWLKAPRCRYVMLLAVTPEAGWVQQLQNTDAGCRQSAAAAEHSASPARGVSALASLQWKQEQVHPRPSQLVLVAFKVSNLFDRDQAKQTVDVEGLQTAEPSEAFTIDSTHVRVVWYETYAPCVAIFVKLWGEPLLSASAFALASATQPAASHYMTYFL